MFENSVDALQNNTNDESMDMLTTYNNLFSNNNYYYNNENINININPYYLAFASTEVLFQKMNIEQFLAYLKLNYNLGFTRNDSYEVRKLATNENGFKKELNKQIAMYWREKNDQILKILLHHSQDPHIFKKIRIQPI